MRPSPLLPCALLLAVAALAAFACEPARTAATKSSPRAEPYVPREVPEDLPPPPRATGPTPADPDVAAIERSADVVRARADALPRTDAGAPRPGSASACLDGLRAQIAAMRRAAEDRREAIRAAGQRGDDELVRHELAILHVLAEQAAKVASATDRCH